MNKISKPLYHILNEDVAELFLYLTKNDPNLSMQLSIKIENPDILNSLENLILQLTRIYGMYAYEQNYSLDTFKERIESSIKKEPLFKKIIQIYLENIDLQDINPDISKEKAIIQKNRIKAFLNKIV